MSGTFGRTAVRPARLRVAVRRWPAGLCIGLALVFSVDEASAAALGGLGPSFGLLVTMAVLLFVKGWPAAVPAAVWSGLGGLLLLAGAAAWLLRHATAAGRIADVVDVATQRGAVPGDNPVATAPAVVALPASFDRPSLVATLRRHFLALQRAWDLRDLPSLQALATPEMLDDLCFEWPGGLAASRSDCTEVMTLEVKLLGFETLAQVFVVSVEFSGMLRESTGAAAVPFRELWMLTQPQHGPPDWRLARHQALL